MAKAQKVPIEQYKIVLELSQEEAELISCLTGNITNEKGSAVRNLSDSIWSSIENLVDNDRFDADFIEIEERN